MNWIGILGLVVALVTAIGTIWYNWRQSRMQVRSQQFTELVDTVRVLDERLRSLRQELKEAEQKIAELKAENASLRERVGELEAENERLRRKLRGPVR